MDFFAKNDKIPDNNSNPYDKLKGESYLMSIGRIKGLASEQFNIFVPNREAFVNMMSLLKKDKYVVGTINVLNLKSLGEFMQELRDGNKPKGMEFGGGN